MLQYVSQILTWVPLELFVFLGSIIEEILFPIPSPLIMTTAGVAAQQAGYSWFGFLILALFGAIGKTIASWAIYEFAEKSEDLILNRYGKYVGLSHARVEKIGSLFSKGLWDDAILFLLRVVPIVPTFLVSVVAGFIKVNRTTFLYTTFLGTIVRNLLFLYIGVYGLQSYSYLSSQYKNSFLIILLFFGVIGVLYFILSIVRKKISKQIHK